jgi:hypothetical protein
MKDQKKGTAVLTEGDAPGYQKQDCQGSFKKNCDALNVWGQAWQDWGEEVRAALRAIPGAGESTNVSPPPPPPFKP